MTIRTIKESAILQAYADDLGPREIETGFVPLYDFYRCYKCDRIITREEEKAICTQATRDQLDRAAICPCGSMKFMPTWPVTTWSLLPWRCDSEWLRTNVFRYTLKLVLARGVAPWCERHMPIALPWIERLVKPKEA